MSKITQLTETTNPSSGDDLVEIVIDTGTTPLSRKMKFLNLLKRVFLGDGTQLTITTIADGEFLKRSGSNLTSAAIAGSTSEEIQDVVGAMFQDGDINFTYDDGGNIETNVLQNQFKTTLIVFEFGDGKNTTSLEADQTARVPYVPAGTIVRARIEGDPSGSAVVDIRKSTTDPPSYSSICAGAKPTLSSDVFVDDETLTGWSTSLATGNALLAVLESVATCKQVTVILEIRKS